MKKGLLVLGSLLVAVARLVLLLAWSRASLRSPEPSLLLQDRHGAYLGEVNVPADGRLGFWPTETLPPRVVQATLAIEDRHFWSHPGVDGPAVARAVVQNLSSGERISGASTLPMQVARLQDPGPRTWPRKAVEALTALFLVQRHGREAVLAQYLRLAPYGNNVHGVRYAARRMFRKPLADLSWAEAALLASLPQAPGLMNPYTRDGRRRATARATRVLDALLAEGALDEATHARAVAELPLLSLGERPVRPEAAILPVLALDGFDAASPEVRTTLDLALQETLEQDLVFAVAGMRARGAEQAAVVVLDRSTLAVRAAVGSIGYATSAGAIDFTRTPRTPGSTLKPLLYALALDRGVIGPNTVLDDLQHGPQGIRNADHRFLGPLLPRQALANSRNVPAVELAQRVGLPELWATWEDLGLHDGTRDPEHYGLGVAIGGMPVRLLDLATAYGALANDGVLRRPTWIEGQQDPGRPVFSAASARLVGRWLSDPVARLPTFPRGGATELDAPVAVKTGTSPDFRDALAVGYSDRFVVAVWVGHPDWRPMQGLGGYQAAAPLLQTVFTRLEDPGGRGLPAPEGWESHTVCAHTGALATDHCDAPREEWFAPGQVPREPCSAHRLEHGRVVTDLPARYHRWMQHAGIRMAERTEATAADRVALTVLSPLDGTKVVRDPDVPADRSTLRLAAAVDPPVPQLLWVIDGEPFAVVEPPYEVRWPVQPGEHTIVAQAVLRPEVSAPVRIEAR